MGRPLRNFEPDQIYFITNRCFQARHLMRPSAEINEIIGSTLAKAAAMFRIELFSFVFLSNHFHMLLRSKCQCVPAFMQYLLGNIAKRVGQEVGWSDKFWQRRYDAAPVLDEAALEERMSYILSHGVKEGLVDHPQDWPGLSSLSLLKGGSQSFAWDGKQYALSVSPLPHQGSLTSQEHAVFVDELVKTTEQDAHEKRGGAAVLGVRKILAQNPHERPSEPKASPRISCHTTIPSLRKDYETQYAAFHLAYAQASKAYREGEFDVPFPPNAYRPPITKYVEVKVAA